MSVDLVADFIATQVSNEQEEFCQDLTHELCMSFEDMARALGMTPRQAEDAAAQAIAQGKIVGRIDQLEGILNCT
ncbi:PCI domain protein [Gregarina niphandrodes]|uniref:PCI domain protein n=1 Tax=Gregarina niphandrodes TaxID=110365 RepID=A0A023B4A1_GRENI|nr:PCI domain protein [Gregarina niphandrodes]EZG56590.1 PCI domain protein [Gregarina niphandrodes]|eukprot:XP_011131225.1 PCI domain protein [Gregarina niphandrodes]